MKFEPCPILLTIAAALSPATTLALADAPSPTCGASDKSAVAERHRQWILNWDRKTPGERWEFDEKFGRFYDYKSNDMVLYDDFDPQHRVARSPGEYSAIWSPPFKTLRTAHHIVIDEPDAIVGENLATSTLEFGARLEAADGSIVGIRTRSTLVWRCANDGWRIVREHNSSRRLTAEETQRLFSQHRAEDNRRIVTAAFNRWAAGGTSFFDEVIAPNVVWRIEGSSRSAGVFRGRAEFMEKAVRPFTSRLSVPVRPIDVRIFADGDHVIAHWEGRATARDGGEYRNRYAWIFRMQDGKAVEAWAFLDLDPYDDVLRRIPREAVD